MRLCLVLLLALLLPACIHEMRRDCAVQVLDHPAKPYPAGRIRVTCDGHDRAVIDAERVHLPAEGTDAAR